MARIAIVYYSGSGNTRKMAQLVAEGAKGGGAQVEMVVGNDANVAEVVKADGFALGSPDYFSYMAGELKTFFDRALPHAASLKGKPYVSFGSHGGGAKVLKSIDELAKAVGLKQVCPGALAQGAPVGESADACRKLGESLAAALNKR